MGLPDVPLPSRCPRETEGCPSLGHIQQRARHVPTSGIPTKRRTQRPRSKDQTPTMGRRTGHGKARTLRGPCTDPPFTPWMPPSPPDHLIASLEALVAHLVADFGLGEDFPEIPPPPEADGSEQEVQEGCLALAELLPEESVLVVCPGDEDSLDTARQVLLQEGAVGVDTEWRPVMVRGQVRCRWG